MDQLKALPLVVKITRVKHQMEIPGPEEHFVGFLVNEKGEPVESPALGEPIYLGGSDTRPWLFKTDNIYSLDVCDEQWVALTEQGVTYIIENSRVSH
jgi:hypothetical protein